MVINLIMVQCVSPAFGLCMRECRAFVMLLVVALIVRFTIFFFFVVRTLSPRIVFFSLSAKGVACLTLVNLPMLPVLLCFFVLGLGGQRRLPWGGYSSSRT